MAARSRRRLRGALDYLRNVHTSREAATGVRGTVPVALDRSFVPQPLELFLRDEDERGAALAIAPRGGQLPTAPAVAEPALKTFSQSLAATGTFPRDAVGNFLRYNASIGGGGSDRVTVQLQDNENDQTHGPISLYPGMRIRGKSFKRVTIVVPTAVVGATAEFVVTTLPDAEDDGLDIA